MKMAFTPGRSTNSFWNIIDFLRNLHKQNLNTRLFKDVSIEESMTSEDEEDSGTGIKFNDMPINNQLLIFWYLDIASLCRAAQVCLLWSQVASDSVLWEIKLKYDSCKWQTIDYQTHPEHYRKTFPDATAKEIYINCCPKQGSTPANTMLPKLNYRYFFGSTVPRIVMFGSGLDSSGIVNRILWDSTSPFTIKGMFPGQFGGIGSGVSLQYDGGSINLICLYALSKMERENPDAEGRPSKLLVEENEPDNDGAIVITLSQPIKQLCATIDAFIYVIDASNEEKVTFRMEEFKAMIDDRWLQEKARVMVLCIVPNATVQSVSSLHVADKLDMLSLSRPWQVRQCHVNSLYGFVPGMKWVTGHV